MSEQLTIEDAARFRVSIVDLDELGMWLIGRLQERHPEATKREILGWLTGCIPNNSFWFVRTKNAIALAEIVRLPLEPQPIAVEHFVLAREGYSAEAASLYPALCSWAANQNASRLDWDRHTDVSRQQFRERCGSFKSTTNASFRLGRLD